jgi:hypothetical protein
MALTLDDGSTVTGDELLIAAGRSFNTDDIGLESVGLPRGGPCRSTTCCGSRAWQVSVDLLALMGG